MTSVLVTGGCGFIGSNFIHYLLETEPEVGVVNFDALTYAGNLANLTAVAGHPRYHFVHGDITDREAVRQRRRPGSHAIINFAAESRTSIAASWIPVPSSAPTSSARRCCSMPPVQRRQRYRSGLNGRSLRQPRPDWRFTEQTPLAPNSPYAASKAAADLLVRSYVHTFGLPAVITRCSNNYGPYQFPEKLIPLFITNLMRERAGAGLRRRPAGARLDPRARPLRRHPPGLARRPARRGLQLRRPLRDAPIST